MSTHPQAQTLSQTQELSSTLQLIGKTKMTWFENLWFATGRNVTEHSKDSITLQVWLKIDGKCGKTQLEKREQM